MSLLTNVLSAPVSTVRQHRRPSITPATCALRGAAGSVAATATVVVGAAATVLVREGAAAAEVR